MDSFLAAFVPAILLAQAATLLGRANEIDLSLDQQCFFVTISQICLFKFLPIDLPEVFVIVASFILLCLILTFRFAFDRRFNANPMIVSIAVGMILLGISYVLIWRITPGTQTPDYPTWVKLKTLSLFSLLVSIIIWIGDLFISSSYLVKVPIRPIGSLPGIIQTFAFAVAPAAILITLAATVLASHAKSVTLSFSQNFGILGATTSMLTFGRLSRATCFGFILGLLYLLGLNFNLPFFGLLIVASFALFINRK